MASKGRSKRKRATPPHTAVINGPPEPHRGIFCNRTLNLRQIAAIGYDMDYTLIHYNVDQWERRAYHHIHQKLCDQGWSLDNLEFDSTSVMRGLIIDTELGNLVKANRFGYIKLARHGTHSIDFNMQRKLYGRTIVDLSESRWVFLNTLFSLSAACLYSQLVNLLDSNKLPKVLSYADLYGLLRDSLDATHMEGILKAEIVADPDRFVEVEAEVPLTLLDQKKAGKRLLLITNSEWPYTQAMMQYAFDPFLPREMTWRDMFDVIIVSARKPDFLSAKNPFFEVVDETGLLKPVIGGPKPGGIFLGGNAAAVEEYLGVSGDRILYVGDHIFSDVHVSKDLLRWRTALVVRELEDEITATQAFSQHRDKLRRLMTEKEKLELAQSQAQLLLQRKRDKYGPAPGGSVNELERSIAQGRNRLKALDDEITPLARADRQVSNNRWGPLMRAGNDKSHMASQIERHADIYMSRVSNFMQYTPFAYFRSPRGSLPHDR